MAGSVRVGRVRTLLLLLTPLLLAPLSGCFGGEDEGDGWHALEIAGRIAGAAGTAELERGVFLNWRTETHGESTLELPPQVLFWVGEQLQINGTVRLPAGTHVGRLLIVPYADTDIHLTMTADGATRELTFPTVNASTPLVSGVKWHEWIDWILSVCSDQSECGGYVNRWMGTGNPAFERGAVYFQGVFQSRGWDTDILRVTDHLNPTQPESLNVIAWRQGERDDCVQGMGAHMDVVPPGGPPGGGTMEGAYDNTAGTTVMLLLAGVLNQVPLECDTFLALWSSEEEGLRGSNAFATNQCDKCLPADKELRFYVNMDMMGISWPAYKPTGDPYPYHAWSGPDDDPEVIEQPITSVMERVHFEILGAPRGLTSDGAYGAGCNEHWEEHKHLTLDVHEDTFGRSDHVTFRDLGAQTIFHLGAYDADYTAYHSFNDTLATMEQSVGGAEELQKSIDFVLWAALLEFLISDATPDVRNVDA